MKQSEVKLKLDNYIGFDDDGFLECTVFLGSDDNPIINQKFSMKEIINDFIDIRSSKSGFDKMYSQQRDLIVSTLEKSIEALKKAA
jgi:hypothetical protein